jgi:hypothetical protein
VTGVTSLPASPSAPLYLAADGGYTGSEPVSPAASIKQVVGEVGPDGKTILVTLDYLVTL